MKKLSLILVALATMVMVGCKPLTGCTHIYDDGVVTEPTCAANGVKTYTCTLCGDKQYEPIPATGNHTWVDTDCDGTVPSAKYYEVSEGVYKLEKVDVSPKYKCSVCGKEDNKTVAFFDSPTTIGVATEVSYNKDEDTGVKSNILPLNDTWTVEKYNSYYGDSSIEYICNCDDCDKSKCHGNICGCHKLTCVRIIHNPDNDMYYFGDYYITVPNN